MANKLILGSANFFHPYGVGIPSQLDHADVATVLQTAKDSGVECIDASLGYGQSINMLVEMGCPIPLSIKVDLSQEIESQINKILELRRKISLHSVALHNVDLFEKEYVKIVINKILSVLDETRFGCSCYSLFDIEDSLIDQFDFIQFPFNVLSVGHEEDTLKFINKKGFEPHVRSIFLQGVLLKGLSEKFERPPQALEKAYQDFLNFCRSQGIGLLEVSLDYLMHFFPNARIVCGVENAEQLILIDRHLKGLDHINKTSWDGLKFIAKKDLWCLDPRKW